MTTNLTSEMLVESLDLELFSNTVYSILQAQGFQRKDYCHLHK